MWIIADVVYDTDEDAQEARRLAAEGKLAGVSVDLGNVTAEIEITGTDDDGLPSDWLETISTAEVLGATQVAMPAFADAHIDFSNGDPVAFLAPEGIVTSDRRTIEPGALVWRDNAPLMFNDTSDGHQGAVHVGNLQNFRRQAPALVASVGVPNLGGPTVPTVSDGQLVGHGAGWGTCHLGIPDACVTAPQSPSQYAHVGESGAKIYRHPHGDIHAPLTLSLEKAQEWYETHCELVGLASVGEDDYGIWASGQAILEDGEYYLSGDWRPVDDQLELISFLVVESPGFPPRALVADGQQRALVAAGIVTETDRMASRISKVEAELADLKLASQITELESVFG